MANLSTINFNYLLKYIIIGDSHVGKSNILLKYIHNQFKDDYQSTIGVEFGAKNIEINQKIYRIQIWDTAGQENFRSITRAYYKNSVCACVCYDITNKESFEHIQSWIEDCKKNSPKKIFFVLIGNKIDLAKNRQVSFEEGAALAEKNDMLFIECSAKTGENITEIFKQSAESINKKIESGFYDLGNESCGIKEGINSSIIKLDSFEETKEKKSCC